MNGLQVEKWDHDSWFVRHQASGMPATEHLRLKRHAEQAMSELYATGLDFTQSKDAMHRDPAWPAVLAVISRWHQRARNCCAEGDGEHYSVITYRFDNGRCSGSAA